MTQHLYRHFNSDGKLLYVGISINALRRLSQHRDHAPWFNEIRRVEIVSFETREAVVRAEIEAIQKEKPLHNIRHRFTIQPVKKSEQSVVNLEQKIVSFKPLYSINEAASALGLSVGRIHSFINNHQLSYVEVGVRKYITGWQIIDFVEFLEQKVRHK